ncbi:hypothetical protein RIF29_28820 [Crotalaria pallida]|uniref:Xylanase inhibitor C-terminal domain-containing protein n=1 Tax=Crotalaria pallida TaxID=3830 RepID=A0AAN9EDM9_CROPI
MMVMRRLTAGVIHGLHYNLHLESISVNDHMLQIGPAILATLGNKGVVIDFGTSLAYLPEEAYHLFVDALKFHHMFTLLLPRETTVTPVTPQQPNVANWSDGFFKMGNKGAVIDFGTSFAYLLEEATITLLMRLQLQFHHLFILLLPRETIVT